MRPAAVPREPAAASPASPRIRRNRKRLSPDVPLGAMYCPWETVFRLFAPTAERVQVIIADSTDGPIRLDQPLTRADHGIWEGAVAGDLAGKLYAYRLSGPGFDPAAEIPDIYATCAQGRCSRTMIVPPSPSGGAVGSDCVPPLTRGGSGGSFGQFVSPTDAIIYEMHVRDLTIAASSGVTRKGKYLGLTESGTHLPGHPDVKTSLDHLVELGITHVQLMPVQDFDNDESRDEYHWGYMPAQFNSPDGAYATTPDGPSRIAELKAAIHALHQRDIGVILDVVYNHTSARAGFERLVPSYYFRMRRGGRFSNGSGCGNEFNSAAPMARKFILDSLKYWLTEYRVDGFRFDLMGLMDLDTLTLIHDELRRLRPDILLYGEPWAAGKTTLKPVTDKSRLRGTGLAAFNDHFRDAIRGDRDGRLPGFVQGAAAATALAHGLAGAIDDWSHDPTDTINYFECHDNLTMWDKLAISDVPARVPLLCEQCNGVQTPAKSSIPPLEPESQAKGRVACPRLFARACDHSKVGPNRTSAPSRYSGVGDTKIELAQRDERVRPDQRIDATQPLPKPEAQADVSELARSASEGPSGAAALGGETSASEGAPTPTALRPEAQGCRAAATLGKDAAHSYPNGVASGAPSRDYEPTRNRMHKLATLILLTAQGTPLLHAGQEFCRTKKGNPNSYNSGDAINAIDWSLKQTHADVFNYTKALIALRKAHPGLHLRTRKDVHARVTIDCRDLAGHGPRGAATATDNAPSSAIPANTPDATGAPAGPSEGQFIAYHLNARGLPGESAHEILVLLNGSSTPAEYRLPATRSACNGRRPPASRPAPPRRETLSSDEASCPPGTACSGRPTPARPKPLSSGEGSWRPGTATETRSWHIYADADRASLEPLGKAAQTVTLPPHSGLLLMR